MSIKQVFALLLIVVFVTQGCTYVSPYKGRYVNDKNQLVFELNADGTGFVGPSKKQILTWNDPLTDEGKWKVDGVDYVYITFEDGKTETFFFPPKEFATGFPKNSLLSTGLDEDGEPRPVYWGHKE